MRSTENVMLNPFTVFWGNSGGFVNLCLTTRAEPRPMIACRLQNLLLSSTGRTNLHWLEPFMAVKFRTTSLFVRLLPAAVYIEWLVMYVTIHFLFLFPSISKQSTLIWLSQPLQSVFLKVILSFAVLPWNLSSAFCLLYLLLNNLSWYVLCHFFYRFYWLFVFSIFFPSAAFTSLS